LFPGGASLIDRRLFLSMSFYRQQPPVSWGFWYFPGNG
jgi:hypothetical protein